MQGLERPKNRRLPTEQRGIRHEIRRRLSHWARLAAAIFATAELERGTALASGGNDALVLNGIPILSPYAVDFHCPRARGRARIGRDAP
jgi:hypothetical protein